MAEIPDDSIDLIMTSPPFLALRSYLPADHPDKAKEIGSEPTPAEFIDTMLALTAEWDRVLAPHGSICIELGDTYSGSGGSGGDYAKDGLRDGQNAFDGSAKRGTNKRNDKQQMIELGIVGTISGDRAKANPGTWPEQKSLCLIPELYRLALAYGINPLTGEPSPSGKWRVRNVVRWHRPNPPVGALGDKFRPSTSDMVIACKSKTRYFDLDAVRHEAKTGDRIMFQSGHDANARQPDNTSSVRPNSIMTNNPAGAPPLDTWVIPTQGYKGSHYATYPEALCVKPIKSMCPERVCVTCGLPSERITSTEYEPHGERVDESKSIRGGAGGPSDESSQAWKHAQGFEHGRATKIVTTTGWADCGHNTWRTGVVLDPFAGSGTTLAVAQGHGRDAIGIDLDERNADLARERVGMFLEVEGK